MSKKVDYEKIVTDYINSLTRDEIEEKFAETARKDIAETIEEAKSWGFTFMRSNLEEFTDRYLREFIDFIDWEKVSFKGRMSINFMREYWDKLHPYIVAENKYIETKDKLKLFKDYKNDLDNQELVYWLEGK